MTDKKVLIISMFLLAACDRSGDTEQQALDAARRAKNSLDAKIYHDDLSQCRHKYRDAGADATTEEKFIAYDRYELCARNADARYYGKDGGI